MTVKRFLPTNPRRKLLRWITLVKKPIWVDLSFIQKKCVSTAWVHSQSLTAIQGGEWDRQVIPISEWLSGPKHQSIRQHFIDGVPWQETPLFRLFKKTLHEKGSIGRFGSLQALADYYAHTYDRIFSDLQQNGVQPPSLQRPLIRPLYVHIDRHGDLMWTTEGNHRFSMLHILGCKRIPVYLYWQHQQSPCGLARWRAG